MEARIVIADLTFEKMIKSKIDETLDKVNLESLIEKKINSKVDKTISEVLSPQKIENFVKDRVSRIITADSLKQFSGTLSESDVLSNIESKIILMIQHSGEFKKLVKQVLKQSL